MSKLAKLITVCIMVASFFLFLESVDAVMELLRDEVIPRGLRIGHPGFTGWVTTAPSTTAAAGHLSAGRRPRSLTTSGSASPSTAIGRTRQNRLRSSK